MGMSLSPADMKSFLTSARSLIAGGLGISIIGFCAEHLYLSGYGINYADYASAADLTIDTLEAIAMVLMLSIVAIIGVIGARMLHYAINRTAIGMTNLVNLARAHRGHKPLVAPVPIQPWLSGQRLLDSTLWVAISFMVVVGLGRYYVSRSSDPSNAFGHHGCSDFGAAACLAMKIVTSPFRTVGAIPEPREMAIIGASTNLRRFFCVSDQSSEGDCRTPRFIMVGRNSSHHFLLATEGPQRSAVVLSNNSFEGVTLAQGAPISPPIPPEPPEPPDNPEPPESPDANGLTKDARALVEAFGVVAAQLSAIAENLAQAPPAQSLVASGEIRLVLPTDHELTLSPGSLSTVRELVRDWAVMEKQNRSDQNERRAHIDSCLYFLESNRSWFSRVRGRFPESEQACLDMLRSLGSTPH